MNNLMIFQNKELGINVRTMTNEDGSICINAEDTARGFGWTRIKNKKTYVMWDRMNGFIEELNFPHKCGKDDFIPESLFYLLAMKANNDIAKKFQTWLAVEVIPQIRKTGQYSNKLLSPTEQLELQLKVLKEQDKRIDQVDQKVENLENNMPLFGVESDELQALVRKYGVKCLGGYHSPAYNDKSLRARVYADIQGQLKREFGVKSYKGIKRCQLDTAKKIIERYELPIVLEDEVKTFNNQISFKKVM